MVVGAALADNWAVYPRWPWLVGSRMQSLQDPCEHSTRRELEAALQCRSGGTRRYKPPVHMIKLTAEREISPYKWVHPDDDDRR